MNNVKMFQAHKEPVRTIRCVFNVFIFHLSLINNNKKEKHLPKIVIVIAVIINKALLILDNNFDLLIVSLFSFPVCRI